MNRVWLLVLGGTLSAGVLMTARASPAAEPIKIDLTQWTPPDIAMVGDDPFGKLVKYGHALFADTANEIGPAVSDPGLRFAGTTALIFAGLFLAISLVTAWVESIFGQAGILTLAALVGASDIDPFVLNLAQGGAPDMGITALAAAVLIAASANNLAKAVYAIGFGGLAAAGRPAIALTVLALLGFAAAVAYLA